MTQLLTRNGLKKAWKILFQAGKDFLNDNAPQWAAAIAYYGLLSIFPLLLAAASIAAYFVDAQWAIQQGTNLIGNLLPSGAQFVQSVIQQTIKARGTVSLFSILALIWSGSRVFGVITKALNIAYDVQEPYGFLKRTLVELLMTLTIGILFALALGSRLLISFADGIIHISIFQQGILYRVLGYSVPAILLLISLFLTYQYVPRRRVNWQAALSGSILATALFLIAQPLFTSYIGSFANYSLIYGPLAIVITLVLWTWITANLLLLGGEVVSHVQDLWVEQKSETEVQTRHEQHDPTNRKKQSKQ